MDKHIPELEGDFSSIYQDFENDVFDALQEHNKLFCDFRNLVVLNNKAKCFPQDILTGIRRFCKHFKKTFTTIQHFRKCTLEAGSVYFALDESDLADDLKKIADSKLRPGLDVGIVTFNETDLIEVLDITVMSTNWEQMGKIAGELIKKRSVSKIRNDFSFIMRGL